MSSCLSSLLGPRGALRRARAVALALALPACGTPMQTDASHDVTMFALSIGRPSGDGGFTEFGETVPLELFLGFQGFKYARVTLRVPIDAPLSTSGRSRLTIDGVEPLSQNYAQIQFLNVQGDSRWSGPVMVFVNDLLLPTVTGRHYVLEVFLRDGDRVASGRVAGTLYYDAECIDDGNGACVPRDASQDAAADATADGSDDAADSAVSRDVSDAGNQP